MHTSREPERKTDATLGVPSTLVLRGMRVQLLQKATADGAMPVGRQNDHLGNPPGISAKEARAIHFQPLGFAVE